MLSVRRVVVAVFEVTKANFGFSTPLVLPRPGQTHLKKKLWEKSLAFKKLWVSGIAFFIFPKSIFCRFFGAPQTKQQEEITFPN